ncbi:MAG TPA: SAM-dependent methyltransferase [Mycobacteriales bacterium]|nr:SAM-dependent methyltransferase [Mycobacteriales bacterium]
MSADRTAHWRVAMADALYGERGFYLGPDAPARNFRTASHAGPVWAQAIRTLADRVDAALGSPAGFTIVDVGAGGGELLGRLASSAPRRWSLVGVDVAPRPHVLPGRVAWQDRPPHRVVGLLVAIELLDVVPLDIATVTERGPRLLVVDPSGSERIGGPLTDADARWIERWRPRASLGDRIEIGRSRDEVWRALSGTVDRGVAVAIDYAADPEQSRAGSLTAYCAGREVAVRPDRGRDLTAHVSFDSLTEPGDRVVTQREALTALGVRADLPHYTGEAPAYLAGLERTGAAAELLERSGLGGFTWLVRASGMNTPI